MKLKRASDYKMTIFTHVSKTKEGSPAIKVMHWLFTFTVPLLTWLEFTSQEKHFFVVVFVFMGSSYIALELKAD